jgi:hypothetical protein
VANELFAMAASVSRAHALAARKAPEAAEAGRMADVFCRMARRRVRRLFDELWDNDDPLRYKTALAILDDRHEWLERGTIGM